MIEIVGGEKRSSYYPIFHNGFYVNPKTELYLYLRTTKQLSVWRFRNLMHKHRSANPLPSYGNTV